MTEATRTVRTMCPMSCHPTLCGMLVDVAGAQPMAVRGDPDNPDSRGFLCVRGRAAIEIIGNPLRLLEPLVRERRQDPLRPATWDEALARIADGIRAAAPSETVLWSGHGVAATNYGTRFYSQLISRFGNLTGAQVFSPSMICWGLGGFGPGLVGMLENHSNGDLGAHAELILMWGASFASQPTLAPHVLDAQRRGAHLVVVDVRRTEAAAKADECIVVRPGTDAALALALIHVICRERLHDAEFVARHTVGFDALSAGVTRYSPQWAEAVTGVPAATIVRLARRYATTRPATIVLGGSSMHKGDNGWEAGHAIACLPGLTGNVGRPGAGFGPRHGGGTHGRGLADVTAASRRVGSKLPNQMSVFAEALSAGRVKNLLLLGTNMASSFADASAIEEGLRRTELVVSYDLFMNETARRHADVVLPGTAWLEEVGCKMTHTHLYLVEQALEPEGMARSLSTLLRDLAERLHLGGFFPWQSQEGLIDAVLDHPSTGHATVATLRAAGGILPLTISPVANPDLRFDTPSGKLEFYSERALELGLSPIPSWSVPQRDQAFPLTLTQGRTLEHFHSFYDAGRALPSLAQRSRHPELWIAPDDARARAIDDAGTVRVHNERGEFHARAHVTAQVPAGTLWLRDGWFGLNHVTGGEAVLPDGAVDLFSFSAGQARFDARVEVSPVAAQPVGATAAPMQ